MNARVPNAGMMVALQAPHGRDVTQIEVFDGLGVEVETPLPLEVGDGLKAQLRDGGPGGRIFSVRVEVKKVVRGAMADAARVRLNFKKPESRAVRLLSEVAARRGLFADQQLSNLTPRRKTAPRGLTAHVSGAEAVPAVMLRFRDPGERRKAIRETLAGALFVRSGLQMELGDQVVCRFVGEVGESVHIMGQVQFVSDGAQGPEGFGLAFETLPRIVQGSLRRLR